MRKKRKENLKIHPQSHTSSNKDTSLNPCNPVKEFHSLVPKHSNMRAYGGYSYSSHHKSNRKSCLLQPPLLAVTIWFSYFFLSDKSYLSPYVTLNS